MTTFFDQLDVRSTCRDCEEVMLVTAPCQVSHPNCATKPTKLESLAAGWLSCIMEQDYKAAALTSSHINRITEQSPQLASAAILYAQWGWPVFPLKPSCQPGGCSRCNFHGKTPCGKRPAIPKSEGGQGFKDASANLEKVQNWWAETRTMNIGLPTGIWFDVIDIDPKNGGVQSFLTLLPRNVLPQVHGIACTASGGIHLYVKPTGKGNLEGMGKVNGKPRWPGIDYRGVGGYVVAPPSWLGNRASQYTWLAVPSPDIKEPF